ncbi:MAG: family 16 glycoside hydrolase [Schlesneria sp.]
MVAKKTEDRYQTMTEVIAALERCRSGPANTVSIQPSETGQPILVQNTSVSSPVMALPSLTRETTDNLNLSSKSKGNESSPVASFTNFLDNLPSAPTKPVRTKTQPNNPAPKRTNSLLNDQKKLLLIGAAVLAALFLLAGVVINMKTRVGEGTLVVKVTEPDADVKVLNEKDKVEITRKGEEGSITITVVPGKHRLRVQKDGFEIFTDRFEIKSGKTVTIRAELKPLVNGAVAGAAVSQIPLDDLKFVEIFNGRDLTGWTLDGDQSNWKVDASRHVLTATGKGSGWLLTNNEYAEFVLKLEYQTEEGSNSGVAILASPADKEHLEVQIGQIAGWATGGVWSDLANNVDAGFIPVKQPAKEKSGDAWNSLEMNLHSGKLKIAVNGTEVLKLDVSELASRPNAYPAWKRTKGRIGLQSQKNAVRFRNIRVAEISPQNSSSEKWNSPAFQQWVKDVQAMPAEKQLKAVSTKLMELNPGFDGKLANSYAQGPPSIVDGVVTELKVFTDRLSDLSPLRALTGLKVLVCRGSSNVGSRANGGLFDLSPLNGMHLVRIECSQNPSLADITPLVGMPLREIVCPGTNVSNLTPLIGMTLRVADLGQTPVFDLSPLKGMPLKDLNILGTKVTNVEPLRGIELDNLIFNPTTILSGLDAIRQMKSLKSIGIGWDDKNKFTPDQFWKKFDDGEFKKPSKLAFQIPGFDSWIKHVQAMPAEKQVEAVSKKLKELNPGFDGKLTDAGGVGTPVIEKDVVKSIGFLSNNVKDISPVRALTGLTDLNCSGSGIGKGKVSDLSPLNDMKLVSLRCDFTQVSNLLPLQEMPLTVLSFVGSNVSHLMPLKGMPLRELHFDEAKKVYDLSPLDGMKITRISFGHSQVSDLSPLTNMKLEYLSFGDTKVSDISVLRGMPLQELLCQRTKVSDFSILRELPLKNLLFDFKPERDTEILRSIKTLETINNKSSAEFWKQSEKKK